MTEFVILRLGYAVVEIFTLSKWFVDRLPDDMECDHGEKSHGLTRYAAPPTVILLPQLHFPALKSSFILDCSGRRRTIKAFSGTVLDVILDFK